MNCEFCNKLGHIPENCKEIEQSCKKRDDKWHLTRDHDEKVKECSSSLRCGICKSERTRCAPHDTFLKNGDKSVADWEKDKYKEFCFYWSKMKASDGHELWTKSRDLC